MSRYIKEVHVRYRELDGTDGVINYLTGDNAAVIATPDSPERAGALTRLRARALKIAGDWSKVFPSTKFYVREE